VTTLEVLAAAALLGVSTLPHCLAMCGPVAALNGACAKTRWRDGGAYLAGRVVGYATLGSVMGALGAHAFAALGGRWLGRAAVVALALACVWQALRAIVPAPASARADAGLLALGPRRSRGMREALMAALPRRGWGLGLATAILPCGALPAAWGLAAASSDPARGAGAMLAFAIASSPALVVALLGRGFLARAAARVPRGVQAAAWLAVAGLLTARLWLAREGCCHG
jgi:uncharacterized protein